jgi:hypothetical protein
MNYLNIVGKVVKKLNKEFFNNNIIVQIIYVEISQTADETEILRLALWDDAITHISEIFNCGDYFLMDGYITLREDDPEYKDEIDPYFEFSVMDCVKLTNNNTFFLEKV